MKIALVVEGESDKIIFSSISQQLLRYGYELKVIQTYGKEKMFRNARKHFEVCKYCIEAEYIVFLPDLDNKKKKEILRKIQVNDESVNVSILVQELEAWLLADGQCIRDAFDLDYSPAGMTDNFKNPKEYLMALFNRKRGYAPTEVELATYLSPYFSLDRAITNNKSALEFYLLLKKILQNKIKTNISAMLSY